MKKLLIVSFLIIVCGTTTAFSRKKSESFEKTNAEAQKIIQFMSDWANLSNKHDTAALDKMLPADLVLTFQDGDKSGVASKIQRFFASSSTTASEEIICRNRMFFQAFSQNGV